MSVSYVIPGAITGCSTVGSLLLSSLECFYSDSNCSLILMNYIKQTYFWYVEDPVWFDIEPFTYNSISKHFLPNTSIGSIMKGMMIERWNPSVSYEQFYESCAPSYCTYTEIEYSKAVFEVIITLISIIGGLTISLRLITPYLVKVFYILLLNITKRTHQEQRSRSNEGVRLNRFTRLSIMIKTTMTSIYAALTSLNIFPLRDFGIHVDRITAKRLGLLTTRLYLVVSLTAMTIFTIYSVTQFQLITKKFDKPSFDYYNYLRRNYGDELKCSCSLIASSYNQFTTIIPVFHEVKQRFYSSLS